MQPACVPADGRVEPRLVLTCFAVPALRVGPAPELPHAASKRVEARTTGSRRDVLGILQRSLLSRVVGSVQLASLQRGRFADEAPQVLPVFSGSCSGLAQQHASIPP